MSTPSAENFFHTPSELVENLVTPEEGAAPADSDAPADGAPAPLNLAPNEMMHLRSRCMGCWEDELASTHLLCLKIPFFRDVILVGWHLRSG